MFRYDDDDDCKLPPGIGCVVRFECLGRERYGRVLMYDSRYIDTFVVELRNGNTMSVSASNATRVSRFTELN